MGKHDRESFAGATQRFSLWLLAGWLACVVASCGEEDATPSPESEDYDHDGFVDDDCDPTDPLTRPGADELCDGRDNDCDGAIDDGPIDAPALFADGDGDGWGAGDARADVCLPAKGMAVAGGDCDDEDPAVHPGAHEHCDDPTDFNCDGSARWSDADRDGTPACEDCDDTRADVHPGADELCDGVDQDCDDDTDEGAVDASAVWADADGDGYGDATALLIACDAPSGHVANFTDCDDDDGDVHPAADELCDGIDQDCDDDVDEDPVDGVTVYPDGDSDGFGATIGAIDLCAAPAGFVLVGGDCDDSDGGRHPAAVELCNGIDDDCNGAVPANEADADGDLFRVCAGDCNDTSAQRHPGAVEVCNAADDNCNGTTDEAAVDALQWFLDVDSDGFGVSTNVVLACSQPAGRTLVAGDCNDANPSVRPSAPERCSTAGVDDDCDGQVDVGGIDATIWYRDADGDSYGVASNIRLACSQPAGYVPASGDCNDGATNVSPGAPELCATPSVDEDCDGSTADPCI